MAMVDSLHGDLEVCSFSKLGYWWKSRITCGKPHYCIGKTPGPGGIEDGITLKGAVTEIWRNSQTTSFLPLLRLINTFLPLQGPQMLEQACNCFPCTF